MKTIIFSGPDIFFPPSSPKKLRKGYIHRKIANLLGNFVAKFQTSAKFS